MDCPACGTENDDTAESCFKCGKGFSLTEGALLASRYEILSFLGRGGMGIVYKAHDRALEEMVALKVLRFDVARTGDIARRFRSEIKLARKVRHPNVCGIHEYGEDGLYRFIVMELIEGRDLRQILRERGAFRPEEACSLAIEVSEGLQAIHDVGVVHRDLKSPNIMLDAHGRVRLMDFGIAKQYGVEATSGSVTATGLVLGTPEYMSPEQARGHKIDFRSDIYALGIIGYEFFTGRVPFKGETPLETIFKHLQEKPVFTGPEAPGIPEPVIPVLRKALAKAPEDRFATASAMAKALRQARAEAFGVSPTAGTTPILTAAAPPTRETAEQTQTIPTPSPARSAGETPSTLPPPTAPPPETTPPAPATVRGMPARATPAAGPTRVLSAEGGPVSARPIRRPARRSRRLTWIVAASVAAVACVAGILWLRSTGSSTGSSAAIPPLPAAAIPTPVAAPVPKEATHAPTTAESPSVPGAVEVGVSGAQVLPLPESAGTSKRSPEVRLKPGPAEAPGSSVAPAASSPAPRPAAVPTPTPTPTPPPPDPPPVEAAGRLRLRVLPWAEVAIDGETVGTTPVRPVPLDVGEHTVVLTHPEYKPLQKSVVIRADETTTLEVDLSYEAFPMN